MNMEHDQTGEISLAELFTKLGRWRDYLVSKWLILLISGLIGGGLGLIYALLQKPVYVAELSFALEDTQAGGGLGGYSGLASMVGVDLGGGGGGAFAGDNLIEFMKSRSMIEKTFLSHIKTDTGTQTLAELYIALNEYRSNWKDKPELKNIRFSGDRTKFTRTQDSILGKFYGDILKDNLNITKKDKKIGIISVIVKSGSEIFSKEFAQTLVKEVSGFYIETKTKKSAENLAILQHQTDSVRRALNYAFAGAASSADLNPNPNMARQRLRVPVQLKQIDIQANQAILTQLVSNLEIAKVSLRKETPLIQIIDRPISPLQVVKFGRLKGIISGGLIGFFLTALVLVVFKVFN